MALNLLRLAFQEFLKIKHNATIFENFECPKRTKPLLFSQLYIYYYNDIMPALVNEWEMEDGEIYTTVITKNKDGKIIF